MRKLIAILIAVLIVGCSAPQKGFNYSAHAKHGAKLKHKAETGRLPKCKRH